jgi:hypothetical protein
MPEHGRYSTYTNHGCRCGPCKEAASAARRRTPARTRGENGSGYVLPSGYVRISVGGRKMLAHRHVMAEHLGRPLHPDETVHHRNGVRHDNVVSNLELRVKAHAAGLSVDEAVEWAEEILRRYRPPN